MSDASTKLRQIFARRYAFAMGLLGLGATTAFLLSFYLASIDTDRSRALNLVNGQRTYSQRIAFLIESLDTQRSSSGTDALRDELQLTISQMREAHQTLLGNHPGSQPIARFIAPLEGFFAPTEAGFDPVVERFLENAEIVTATSPSTEAWDAIVSIRREVVRAATDTIMQTHGLMALVLETEASRLNRLERTFLVVAWVFMLALLALVTFVIFRPMSRRILSAFEDIERAEVKAREAEEGAKTANEARGHFIQAASHELKTPLNAILGMADALHSAEVPGLDKELRQLVSAANQLLMVLNNILDSQRLAEGKLTLDETPFRLADAFDEPVSRAKAMAEEKAITFSAFIDVPDTLEMVGDQRRLEQLFLNLLDNAVKFTHSGSVRFNAATSGEGTAQVLDVSVRDTGVGIARARQEKVFERFSAEGSMSARRGGGLGVGLSLVKEIVTSMGGEITLDSAPGRGTTVGISVPIDAVESSLTPVTAQPKANATPDEDAGIEPGDAENESVPEVFDVLVVDDNMANRMVAEALVRTVGGQTVTAADGRQAVERATEAPFDIILMDISMPVLDGIEATRLIRAGEGPNKATPIVAVTAHMGPEDRSELERSGFSDVLSKPVRKDMIARCMERWVAAAASMREVA